MDGTHIPMQIQNARKVRPASKRIIPTCDQTSWTHSTGFNPGVQILHESQWCNKTKHHELTQLASIQEYRFYTNPSVHGTKAKVQGNQNNRYKITQPNTKLEARMRHTSQCNTKVQQKSDRHPNRWSRSATQLMPRKLEKIGWHAKWGKNPKFWKNCKIKTHLAFGYKNPQNPKNKQVWTPYAKTTSITT